MKQVTTNIINRRKGYELYLSQPYHQGIYISNIRRIAISIDGQNIEKGNIWIEKNNIEIPIEHICIIGHEFWDVNETVKIVVRNSNRLTYGSHDVEIKLTIFERDATSPTLYKEVTASQIRTYGVENCYID